MIVSFLKEYAWLIVFVVVMMSIVGSMFWIFKYVSDSQKYSDKTASMKIVALERQVEPILTYYAAFAHHGRLDKVSISKQFYRKHKTGDTVTVVIRKYKTGELHVRGVLYPYTPQ